MKKYIGAYAATLVGFDAVILKAPGVHDAELISYEEVIVVAADEELDITRRVASLIVIKKWKIDISFTEYISCCIKNSL